MVSIQTTGTRRQLTTVLLSGILFLATLFSETVKADQHESFELPYHLSFVLADTYVNEKGHNATLGIDVEFRINSLLGFGAVVEHAWGELDSTTVLAVANIHFAEDWVMQIGPGLEYHHGEKVSVSRLGLLYEFEWNHYTFSPQLHWNYLNGEENAVVAGFSVGFSF